MPRDETDTNDSESSTDRHISEGLISIPEVLRNKLQRAMLESETQKQSTLISSNTLANQFIFENWGIRSSQRRRYRNLFTQIRRQCRNIFRHYLKRGWLEIRNDSSKYTFEVYKYDEKRGNIILGFVRMQNETEWTIPPSGG